MNYQLTDTEKHNLEIYFRNLKGQILHLDNLLSIATKENECDLAKSTEETLLSYNKGIAVLENLSPISEWQDLESDVHKN